MHLPTHQSPELSEAEFSVISEIAHREAGLVFTQGKASLVQSRINRRLRKLGITSFSKYISLISSPQGKAELKLMISSLTTNISSFFRESHHFDILADSVLPPLLKHARAGGRVRIWSAGCSTGEEPYSIAMTLCSVASDVATLDVKILASDIDENVLNTARYGIYSEREIVNVNSEYRNNYFLKSQNGSGSDFQITNQIRSLVSFRELNLLRNWPMNGDFDVIFCRNVVIYFDEETQLSLWPRFESITASGGWLFVGHSERLPEKLDTHFQNVGPTTYKLPNKTTTSAGLE